MAPVESGLCVKTMLWDAGNYKRGFNWMGRASRPRNPGMSFVIIVNDWIQHFNADGVPIVIEVQVERWAEVVIAK